MIKKVITYQDFEGRTVTGLFYFHLSKKTLIQMAQEGYQDKLTRIGNEADGGEIMATITEVLSKAYGLRVEGDDSTFKQSEQISEDFINSLAFDSLLMEFITEPAKAIDFINSIFPQDLIELAEKMGVDPETGLKVEKQEFVTLPGNPSDSESGLKTPRKDGTLVPWAFREPNDGEIQHMTKPQLQDVMRRKASGWKAPSPV